MLQIWECADEAAALQLGFWCVWVETDTTFPCIYATIKSLMAPQSKGKQVSVLLWWTSISFMAGRGSQI